MDNIDNSKESLRKEGIRLFKEHCRDIGINADKKTYLEWLNEAEEYGFENLTQYIKYLRNEEAVINHKEPVKKEPIKKEPIKKEKKWLTQDKNGTPQQIAKKVKSKKKWLTPLSSLAIFTGIMFLIGSIMWLSADKMSVTKQVPQYKTEQKYDFDEGKNVTIKTLTGYITQIDSNSAQKKADLMYAGTVLVYISLGFVIMSVISLAMLQTKGKNE